MSQSALGQLIGGIESGNNPNASLTDYAGNVSVNAQYQQSAAYVARYGAGEDGVLNQANQLLASNPNATLGDFYTEYNHGSVLPWDTYSSRFPQQANNFLINAQSNGYDQNTPLSNVVGTSGTGQAGVTGAGSGTAFDSLNPEISADASATGNNQGTPDLGGGVAQAAPVSGNDTTGSIPGVTAGVDADQVATQAPQGSPVSAGGGIALTITNAGQIGQGPANTIAQADTNLGKAVQSSEGKLAASGTSWLGSVFDAAGNVGVRAVFVALGLIMLAGAFAFFYMEGKSPIELAGA